MNVKNRTIFEGDKLHILRGLESDLGALMNVTFDTNVWEPMVEEEKPHLIEIKNAIRDGKIHAYICEITLNLEAIQKVKRAEFFENYKHRTTVEDLPPENGTLGIRVGFGPDTELHPGIHPKQWAKLLKARDLGFKILRMTNIGTVCTKEIPDDMYVQHDNLEEFWRYAEPLANCNDFIVELGYGGAAYEQFKAQYNLVGSGGQALPAEHERKFSEAVAEWVDGEALSAHYAAGNDCFCTDDKAGKAGTGSIFHDQNRTQLEKEFGIKIISSCRLAQLLRYERGSIHIAIPK